MSKRREGKAFLPLPDVVNPEGTICITFAVPDNLIHIANFWGVIDKLAHAYNYADDPAHTAVQVASVWRGVVEAAYTSYLENECGGTPEEGQCLENNPSSPILQWWPQNPFTQPNLIPDGYQNPPWHVVTEADTALLALGFLPGDVQTDLLDFPPGTLPTVIPPGGLPRFRVSFDGTDDPDGITVELHFVIIPAGGRVVIIDDGQIINPPPEIANMNRDVLAVPPVTSLEVVIERKFMGTGTHTCEAQMFPAVNDEIPFLYFGGGLRKVVICGKDLPDMVAEFRQTDCILEYRPNAAAAWATIYDPTNCITERVEDIIEEMIEDGVLGGGQPGAGGAGPGPTECQSFTVVLRANERWLCPVPIKANYQITVSEATGGASDGTPFWWCPSGETYVLGSCGPGGESTDAGDPMPAEPHMSLIMGYDGNFYTAYNETHNVSSGLVGSHQLEFQVNDSTLGDNSGSYAFKVEICNAPTHGLQYDAASGQHATITQTDTFKWHVAIEAHDDLPFVPYEVTLWYGLPTPDPIFDCVHFKTTNATGWSADEPDHHVWTAIERQCDDDEVQYFNTNPATVFADGCWKSTYWRSNTPMEFDIEILFDC